MKTLLVLVVALSAGSAFAAHGISINQQVDDLNKTIERTQIAMNTVYEKGYEFAKMSTCDELATLDVQAQALVEDVNAQTADDARERKTGAEVARLSVKANTFCGDQEGV